MNTFWQFENRWLITATLRMKTALSVGSRASLLPAGSDLPVIKTPEGVPFIPGSSLKGVVRTYVERVLRTLDGMNTQHPEQRLWACDPLDEKNRCVTADRKKELLAEAGEDDARFTGLIWQHSCTACRLFGSPWLASRVAFQDAMLANRESLLRLTEVRDGVGIDRDLGSAKAGIKYDFETVPAGAEFRITIVVENAEEWEAGLLLLALKAIEKGELPIGGKTTRGPGWGELVDLEVQHIGKDTLLAYLTGSSPPEPKDPAQLLRRFSEQLNGGSHA
ncbi:MAG: CRISPR-associated RAMP protein Csx7 [Chlorobiota bacterium]|nr:CRISPR-associated RAMP protein Csx7 [Chlorobiota bacterium]